MTQMDLGPRFADHTLWSDPALIAAARRGDEAGIHELVERHALAMTRFETTVGMAVTREPGTVVHRLILDERLPLRAAWLADRASDYVHDQDDDFLLARFTELTTAWRTALWHAEVEGDSPVAIGRLLGIGADQATLTVRTARSRLLWSVVAATPTGSTQTCLDTAAQLCGAGADPRHVLALASEHGRTCDECMLLVKRALLFASSLRDSLLRSVAGELAVSYSAFRPPAFRPRARGDLAAVVMQHSRPAVVTFAMAGAAAVAVAALAVAPGAVSPYLSPERDVAASVVQGQLLLPVAVPAPVADETVRTPDITLEESRTSTSSPDKGEKGQGEKGQGEKGQGEKGQGGGTDSSSEPEAPTDTGGAPTTPGTPPPSPPPAPVDSGTDGNGGNDKPGTEKPGSWPVPGVEVTVGPVTVDTGGDEPLVTIDGPVPVEVPPLPDLGTTLTQMTGGVVSGLLG